MESEHPLFRSSDPCIYTAFRNPSSFTAKLISARQTTRDPLLAVLGSPYSLGLAN